MFISPVELLIVGGLVGLLLVLVAPASIAAIVAFRRRRDPAPRGEPGSSPLRDRPRPSVASAPFVPSTGVAPDLPDAPWILVRGSDAVTVAGEAVEWFSVVEGSGEGPRYRVHVLTTTEGVAVLLPEGFPTYGTCDLTGWLGRIGTSIGWQRAPSSGRLFCLRPDRDNPAGDTLLGADEAGEAVRVYIPDGSLAPMRDGIPYVPPPRRPSGEGLVVEGILTLGDPDFGNLGFSLTHPEGTAFQAP